MKAKLLKIDQKDHLVVSTKNEAEGLILKYLFNHVKDTDKLSHGIKYGDWDGETILTFIIKGKL